MDKEMVALILAMLSLMVTSAGLSLSISALVQFWRLMDSEQRQHRGDSCGGPTDQREDKEPCEIKLGLPDGASFFRDSLAAIRDISGDKGGKRK